jgi:hypothetical protein
VNYTAGDFPNSVATGDFDGDGITDLVIANRNSRNVSLMLGNGSAGTGDGTFAGALAYPVGDAPRSVTTGDFNGDGLTDLAVANQVADNVSILLNLGFSQPNPTLNVSGVIIR